MKKKLFSDPPQWRRHKILQIMKLTIILTLVFSMNLSATGFGQITLAEKEKSVKEILGLLEKQTSYRFFYNDDLRSIGNTVDIDVRDGNISQVLDHLFRSTECDYKIMDNNLIVITVKSDNLQQLTVSGRITDASNGEPLPGVSISVKGTVSGVISDVLGNYSVNLPSGNSTLVFSFVGYMAQEVPVANRTKIDVLLAVDVTTLEEVVVVGYGTQKKSDITGTVASISQERLAEIPQVNIAQAVQGAIPGVMIQTVSAGAEPNEVILIRGRNSIKASNNPLIVVDGIPYGGQLSDINLNDVKSIEVLKDASAGAIYGSRGSNGVILITTKSGVSGELKISYEGYYSTQKYTNLPPVFDGKEFYEYKMQLVPTLMTAEETAIYEAGTWENWYDVITRTGSSQQHNLSMSGGSEKTKFFISGGLLDVKGLTLNDDFLRATSRINLDSDVKPWLTLGTRTQFSYDDKSGIAPSWSDAFSMNPLTRAYDENGNINVYPWENNPYYGNPLAGMLYKDMDESTQILLSNFAIIRFPFVDGLNYRINSGFRFRFYDKGTYRGRDTKQGLEAGGISDVNRARENNTVIENILTYNKEFGKSSIFATAVYSFESDKNSSNSVHAEKFPHDFLSWFSPAQAELISPAHTLYETRLISQMLRLNYSYNQRYLVTLTARRDGYSGFGLQKKWGIFPSLALGWNVSKENFFPFKEIINELKLRGSYGLNGNQAVGAYETITRLEQADMVDKKITVPGYMPSVIGDENLGWESSKTLNLGIDFALFKSKITGDFNVYKTMTSDLLLDRAISPAHGISSITQNIGKVENTGLELSLISRNISSDKFQWNTSGNISFTANKIIALYGVLNPEGNEIDDVANMWFIGQPVRVNYDFVRLGNWQLDEIEEAAKWGSQPGFIKIKDVNGDYKLDANDLEIIGQRDPDFLWGLTNSFSYSNFKLDVFFHGVHGVTLRNSLMANSGTAEVRDNVMKKDFWTPDNPTNVWQMVHQNSNKMGGVSTGYYQDASFVRLKDVSLSYSFPSIVAKKIGLNNLRLYLTGRNLITFTGWIGLDPELSNQKAAPLQREFIFGLDFGF